MELMAQMRAHKEALKEKIAALSDAQRPLRWVNRVISWCADKRPSFADGVPGAEGAAHFRATRTPAPAVAGGAASLHTCRCEQASRPTSSWRRRCGATRPCPSSSRRVARSWPSISRRPAAPRADDACAAGGSQQRGVCGTPPPCVESRPLRAAPLSHRTRLLTPAGAGMRPSGL